MVERGSLDEPLTALNESPSEKEGKLQEEPLRQEGLFFPQ